MKGHIKIRKIYRKPINIPVEDLSQWHQYEEEEGKKYGMAHNNRTKRKRLREYAATIARGIKSLRP